jgi:hypothetical protein
MAATAVIACNTPKQNQVWIQQLSAGERELYPGKMQILPDSKREWVGDSAMQMMAPYPLLAENPAMLKEKLGLELDAQALEEIGIAWEHWSKGNWQQEQGHQADHSWQAESPFVPGAMALAGEELPIVTLSLLHPSDSTFLENPRRIPEWSEARFRSLRIVDRHPLCLLAVHAEMCHASLYTNCHDYLFYNSNGLLRAMVHLEDPCEEGRTFAYARYAWSDSLQIQRLDVWSADESMETNEIHARQEAFKW